MTVTFDLRRHGNNEMLDGNRKLFVIAARLIIVQATASNNWIWCHKTEAN